MKTEMLPVDGLELDLNNPRIARILEMYDPDQLTAEQISLALGAGGGQEGETYTTFYSLKESIRTNGGVIQPIIVNRQQDGKMVVIEGNTRVQIYRDFQQDGVPGNWTEVPAIVYEDLSKRGIDAIRLQAHLVGPRPWDPYSKARYLNYLRNSHHLTLDQIVEFCGGRRREVLDYIAAYRDMENHYRPALPAGHTFDATRFSAFVELQRPHIQQALAQGGFGKADFARWVIAGFFRPLQNIRHLPRILENERARGVFLEDGAAEASRLLQAEPADATLAEASLMQLAQALTRRIARLEFRDIQRLRADPTGDEREALFDARSHLAELFTYITDEEDA